MAQEKETKVNEENLEKDAVETVNEEDKDKKTAEAGNDEAENTEAAKTAETAEAAEPEKNELEELNNKYMMLLADFQNFRRRSEQEKTDIRAFANENIVKELLDVIDNFERALATDCADEGFKKGMELILKQLRSVLERAGVSEIEALGKEFDPNFHNAVMMEDSEEYESGQVTFIIQKGYILNNRVIRPSMVKVAN